MLPSAATSGAALGFAGGRGYAPAPMKVPPPPSPHAPARSAAAGATPEAVHPSRQARGAVGLDAAPPRGADEAGGEPSDESLLAAHIAGAAGAFRTLFDRHAPRVFGALRRRGLSEADAKDVVQQTFLLVHQARKDFRSELKVRPWLWTIAFNTMRMQYRSRMRSEERAQRWALQRELAQPLLPVEDRKSVQKAIEHLSAAHQEVVLLHWYEGLSFAEVATIVAASESAVKVRAHRAYRRLRELLEPAEPPNGAET